METIKTKEIKITKVCLVQILWTLEIKTAAEVVSLETKLLCKEVGCLGSRNPMVCWILVPMIKANRFNSIISFKRHPGHFRKWVITWISPDNHKKIGVLKVAAVYFKMLLTRLWKLVAHHSWFKVKTVGCRQRWEWSWIKNTMKCFKMRKDIKCFAKLWC